jgi:hypothetical protein
MGPMAMSMSRITVLGRRVLANYLSGGCVGGRALEACLPNIGLVVKGKHHNHEVVRRES